MTVTPTDSHRLARTLEHMLKGCHYSFAHVSILVDFGAEEFRLGEMSQASINLMREVCSVEFFSQMVSRSVV